LGVCSRIGAP